MAEVTEQAIRRSETDVVAPASSAIWNSAGGVGQVDTSRVLPRFVDTRSNEGDGSFGHYSHLKMQDFLLHSDHGPVGFGAHLTTKLTVE